MPRKDIDYKVVEDLAAERISQHDIAVYLCWNPDSFSTRKGNDKLLREALQRGYSRYNIELQKAQNRKAITGGDTKLLIHLGKNYLGQSDKIQLSGDEGSPISVNILHNMSDDDLDAQEKLLAKYRAASDDDSGGDPEGESEETPT